MTRPMPPDAWRMPAWVAAALVLGAAVGAGAVGPRVAASERGRSFSPQALTLRRGDALEISNDEATAVHHAYVDDPGFSYDAGEQGPGDRADIAFTRAGTFAVLCGIHPRMRLVVTVED